MLLYGSWQYRSKNQRDLNRQLFKAVNSKDVIVVRSLLKRGANPNVRFVPDQPWSLWQQVQLAFHADLPTDPDASTPLWDAVTRSDSAHKSDEKNIAVIETLLNAGARGQEGAGRHLSALMPAVWMHRCKVVQMLLDHGANTLARDEEGKQAIYYLDEAGDDSVKIAELLISHGCDVNAVDDKGRTPLMSIRLYGGKNTVLKYLLAHGANVNARSKEGESALSSAVPSSNIGSMQMTIPGKSLPIVLGPARATAIEQNMPETSSTAALKLLIEYGADVRSDAGGSPLLQAASNGDIGSTRLLLEHGAIPGYSGKYYKITPLHNAANGGHVEVVKLLLAHGAAINALDWHKDTPLTSCLQYRNQPGIVDSLTATIKELIASGADVGHHNKFGESALSLAKKWKYSKIVAALEAAGAAN